MYEEVFSEAFNELNDFIIDLSLANFLLFHNTQRKHFSRSLYLLKSEILDCKAVALVKKGLFRKYFFRIFDISQYPLFSDHFQNVSVVQFRSRL